LDRTVWGKQLISEKLLQNFRSTLSSIAIKGAFLIWMIAWLVGEVMGIKVG